MVNDIDDVLCDFIVVLFFVFVVISDDNGNLDVLLKGDVLGFCIVEDDWILVFLEWLGNKLVYGFLNIFNYGKIGLIFLLLGVCEILCINGMVMLIKDFVFLEKLFVNGKFVLFVICVSVDECFMYCGKVFICLKFW